MSLKGRINRLRDEAVRRDLDGAPVPERYRPVLSSVGGAAEHLYVVRRLLLRAGQPRDVLVVGCFGGRDFWGLRLAGHRVTGFDLATVPDCRPLVRANAEAPWPFADASFDAVVMGEVLEHLIHDFFALAEVRRVLRPGGVLLGTVPFLHDENDYHVRIHNPASIRRLLGAAGFAVEEFVERPGILSLAPLNYLNHPLAAAVYALTGRSIYPALARFYGGVEFSLGRRSWIPRHLLKALGLVNWGATFLALPSGEFLDYKALNRLEFSEASRRRG
jgi:SAM-dependent methyltransferase